MPQKVDYDKIDAENQKLLQEAERLASGVEIRAANAKAAEEGPLAKGLSILKRGVKGASEIGGYGPAGILAKVLGGMLPEDPKKTAADLSRVTTDVGRYSPGDKESSVNKERAAKAALTMGAEIATTAAPGSPGGILKMLSPTSKVLAPVGDAVLGMLGNRGTRALMAGAQTAAAFNAPSGDYSIPASSMAGVGMTQALSRIPALQNILKVGEKIPEGAAGEFVKNHPMIEAALSDAAGQAVDGREGYDYKQGLLSGVLGGLPGTLLNRFVRSSAAGMARTPEATKQKVLAALGGTPSELETDAAQKGLAEFSAADLGRMQGADLFEQNPLRNAFIRKERKFSTEKAEDLLAERVKILSEKAKEDAKIAFDKELASKDPNVYRAPTEDEYKALLNTFTKDFTKDYVNKNIQKEFQGVLGNYNEKLKAHDEDFGKYRNLLLTRGVGMLEEDSTGKLTGIGRALSDKLGNQQRVDEYVKLQSNGRIRKIGQKEFDTLTPDQRKGWSNVTSVTDPVRIKTDQIKPLLAAADEAALETEVRSPKFNDFAQRYPAYQKALNQVIDSTPETFPLAKLEIAKRGVAIASSDKMKNLMFEPKEFDATMKYFGDKAEMRPLMRKQIAAGMTDMFTEFANISKDINSDKVLQNLPSDKFKAAIGGTPERIKAFNDLYENPKAFENMTNLLEANELAMRQMVKKKFDVQPKKLIMPVMFMGFAGAKMGLWPMAGMETVGFGAAGALSGALHYRANSRVMLEKAVQDPSGKLATFIKEYSRDPVKNSRLGTQLARIFNTYSKEEKQPD